TGVPKDIEKAVRLLQAASLADNVDAEVEYAIALYNGRGTPKNQTGGGGRVREPPSLADNVDAEVEYAIALYNGSGTPKNQPAAVALLRKAARQNSPIAQNRLARVLVGGQGRR